MKKLVFLFLFAFCATMTYANSTDPVKSSTDASVTPKNVTVELLTKNEKAITAKTDAQCTYCAFCLGIRVCVGCTCNNCDKAFDALSAALCAISPLCCYSN